MPEVLATDLDGDGDPDVVTRTSWYDNGGRSPPASTRHVVVQCQEPVAEGSGQ